MACPACNKEPFFFVPCPLRWGGYEGVHHTPSVIWFRAYSSTNLCMAFVSTGIRTPALVVRSQSSIHWATPQLAVGSALKKREHVSRKGHTRANDSFNEIKTNTQVTFMGGGGGSIKTKGTFPNELPQCMVHKISSSL